MKISALTVFYVSLRSEFLLMLFKIVVVQFTMLLPISFS